MTQFDLVWCRVNLLHKTEKFYEHPSWNGSPITDFLLSRLCREGLTPGLIFGLDDFWLATNTINQSPSDVLILTSYDQHFSDLFYSLWPKITKEYICKVFISVEPVYSVLAGFDAGQNSAIQKHEKFINIFQPDIVVYGSKIDVRLAKERFGGRVIPLLYHGCDRLMFEGSPTKFEDKLDEILFVGKPDAWVERENCWSRSKQLAYFRSQKVVPFREINGGLSYLDSFNVVNNCRFHLQARCGSFFHAMRSLQAAIVGTIPIILIEKNELEFLQEECPELKDGHNALVGINGEFGNLLERTRDYHLVSNIAGNLNELSDSMSGRAGIKQVVATISSVIQNKINKSRPLDNNSVTVFDIGSHNGQSIARLYQTFRSQKPLRIYCFEPIPENFELLKEAAKKFQNAHHDCTIVCYNLAVSDFSGLSDFYCYGMHTLESNQYSSLCQFQERDLWLKTLPDQPKSNLELTKTIKVKTIRLDDFINAEGVGDIEFIKIDTQGNDYQVLMGLGVYLNSNKVAGFEIECQTIKLYKGSRGRDSFDDLLSKHGYKHINTTYQANGYEQVVQYRGDRKIDEKHEISKKIPVRRLTSSLKVDIVAPLGQHAWAVREGWINTIKDCRSLGTVYFPQPTEVIQLLNKLKNNQADIILLLGFDHHLKYLHMDDRLRDLWKSLRSFKIMLAQETVVQDCYPGTREMTRSAIECVDFTVFNTPSDAAFYKAITNEAMWQPFAYDPAVYKNIRPFKDRYPKAFFRGKYGAIGGPSTYQRRRELLEILSKNNTIDHLSFDPKLDVKHLVDDFNRYQISLNLPAVFQGYTTRVFEAMGTGTCLVTPHPHHPDENSLFTSGKHLVHYDPDDSIGLVDLLNELSIDHARSSRIAEAAYEEVNSKHQILHRWNDIIKSVGTKDRYLSVAPVSVELTSNLMPVHFFTIVLNGNPFIQYHIDALKSLDFDWHWHIIEGVADLNHDTSWCRSAGGQVAPEIHLNGLSIDGTSDYIDGLAVEFPDRVSIYRKPKNQFWDGKVEMVNAPLINVPDGALLWQIDADELWTAEQIGIMRTMFLSNPDRSSAYFWCKFFVGPNRMVTTLGTYGNMRSYEWLRVHRYEGGARWSSHEPPILITNLGDQLARRNPFMHAETARAGLVFEHMAYAHEDQIMFKEKYYGYRGAVDSWRSLQLASDAVKLSNYFPWVKDHARAEIIAESKLDRIAKIGPSGNWIFNSAAAVKPLVHIVYIRPDSIGDALLSNAILPYIKKRWPSSLLTVVCQDRVAELYHACPYINEIISFDRARFSGNESYRSQLLDRIAGLKSQIALCPVYSRDVLGDLLVAASRAEERIGFSGDLSNQSLIDKVKTDRIYTRLIESNKNFATEMERYSDFISGIGVRSSALSQLMWIDRSDEQSACDYFCKFNIANERVVAFFPGAQSSMRLYGGYRYVLEKLVAEGWKVLAFGSQSESEIVNNYIQGLIGVENLCGQLSLGQVGAMMRCCTVGLGAESGLNHMAAAVGLPHAIVLGGGHFGRFCPISHLTVGAILPLDCYECNWQCRFNRPHCVSDLNSAVVLKAVLLAIIPSKIPRLVIQDSFVSVDSMPNLANLETLVNKNRVECHIASV
jgi:FkbM family methyltransferase